MPDQRVSRLEMCRAPAVDVDDLARDVRSVIEQETHRARNIQRTSGMLEQGVVDDVFPCFGIERTVFGPQDGAGRNGVDAYLRGQLNGQSPRQAE